MTTTEGHATTPALFRATIETPLGSLTALATDRGLCAIQFPDDAIPANARPSPRHGHAALACRQLGEYFARRRTSFDVPFDWTLTPFRRRVLAQVVRIPFGATRSYGEIAQAIGQPGAARAVGGANHANPIPLIVPCHRVIGATGQLVGYGGGLASKRWLLAFEGAIRVTA
ncbi:MAG: methylated-DNA--[protein]-cysteine S-methyltransferase [Gammaproteobacteria bacterium]|nr:methylated-DNA--[protein]-cysteine S-methyltransferase [Gammaproteobacteria bacterium]